MTGWISPRPRSLTPIPSQKVYSLRVLLAPPFYTAVAHQKTDKDTGEDDARDSGRSVTPFASNGGDDIEDQEENPWVPNCIGVRCS